MPFFSDSRNIDINGGNFTDISIGVINTFSAGQASFPGIEILLKASSPDATYDSSARETPPRCFPGTREQYIEDIVNWVAASACDNPLPILWMKGLAGVGKTAIAQTCVEKLKEMKKPCLAFFFSVNGRSKHECFFPSIAYQLSTISPAYRTLVDQKLRNDVTLVNKCMESQFRSLLLEPLEELAQANQEESGRIPVFLDGLDECEDPDAQCRLIEMIAAARDKTRPLCWAFFSRPESHIEGVFSRPEISAFCYSTVLPVSHDADGDIELYLRSGFANILQRFNASESSWKPSDEDIRLLVRAAGGLFIYAATVLRFISQSRCLGPEKALRVVLATIINRGREGEKLAPGSLFAELDAFYMLIMQRITPDMFPRIQLLCSLLHYFYNSSLETHSALVSSIVLSNIMEMSALEFKTTCDYLGAVLRVHDEAPIVQLNQRYNDAHSFSVATWDDVGRLRKDVQFQLGGSVTFYHKSFHDFLVDPERSGNFCINTPAANELFLKHLLAVRLGYEKSYLIKDGRLILAPQFCDSAASLSSPAKNEFVNSAIKACVHLSTANIFSGDLALSRLHSSLLQQLEECNFRKELLIRSELLKGPVFIRWYRWRCKGHSRTIGGVEIFRTLPGEFDANFDRAMFKKVIKMKKQAGMIKPYHSSFILMVKTLLNRKGLRSGLEIGCYRIGSGHKSIFWYWEMDAEEGLYSEFHAIDLEEGMRVYQQDKLGSWPDFQFVRGCIGSMASIEPPLIESERNAASHQLLYCVRTVQPPINFPSPPDFASDHHFMLCDFPGPGSAVSIEKVECVPPSCLMIGSSSTSNRWERVLETINDVAQREDEDRDT